MTSQPTPAPEGAPDFAPAPRTEQFAVVEEVAETIAAVESLRTGPTASPEMERAAAEAAAEARMAGLDLADPGAEPLEG